MLVRRIARPLLAAAYVAEGVSTVREPEPHVSRVEESYHRLSERLDLPAMSRDRLRTLVRVHGALCALAGAALAVGRAPRTAALVLAGLMAPVAASDALTASGGLRASGPALERLWRHLTMVGAAVIAAVDLEGRPGVSWRVSHARYDRDRARAAKDAVTTARREAKAARKQAARAA